MTKVTSSVGAGPAAGPGACGGRHRAPGESSSLPVARAPGLGAPEGRVRAEGSVADPPPSLPLQIEFGGECHISGRPYTVFRWKPGADAR